MTTSPKSPTPTAAAPPPGGWARLALVLLVGFGGLALSLTLYGLLQQRERQLAEAKFELDAKKRVEVIEQALADRLGAVRLLEAFYAGSQLVERQEFHTFVGRLLAAYPDLDLLAWAPRVPAAQRAAHQQAAAAEGLRSYQITEPDAHGRLVAAGGRDEYFPLYYLEPWQANESLLGFDLGSRGECAAAVRRMRQTGRLVAVAAPPLGSGRGGGFWLYVMMPAYNEDATRKTPPAESEGPDGIVVGIFPIEEVVNEALASSFLDPAGIDTYLFDATAAGEYRTLSVHPSRQREQPRAPEIRFPLDEAGTLHHTARLGDDLQWTAVLLPIESYVLGQRTWWPAGALGAGILLSGLLAGCLGLLVERTARIERLVTERTTELRTISNAALDAVVMIDPAGKVVHWNPAAERIFGYPREEILGRGPHEVLAPARYHERIAGGLRQFARSGQGPVVGAVVELTALRKDGTEFPIEISVAAIPFQQQWGAVAIVRDITHRKRAEEALHQEQRLLRELLDLQDRERKLVAYEIHDGLAQQLAAALWQLEGVERLRQENLPQAQAVFDAGVKLLRQAMTETRRLIGGLRPPVLDESGLVAAIDFLIAEQRQRGGPEIEFASALPLPRFAAPLESTAFRIVQECLANACRHSRSPKVRVALTQTDAGVRIEVQDWGIGFDPAQVAAGHFGVQGIRERARLFGGTATIDAAPGQGTSVTVELPLPQPGPNEAHRGERSGDSPPQP